MRPNGEKMSEKDRMRLAGRFIGVAATLALTLALPSTAAALSFTPGAHAVGGQPRVVAIGDLNGDGKPDLATVNISSDHVTVLLGNGSGGFSAAAGSPFAAGDGPSSVAIGDLNGDGEP